MYPVSNAFQKAVESNSRKYYWHGTIDTVGKKHYDFTDQDIVKGSGKRDVLRLRIPFI